MNTKVASRFTWRKKDIAVHTTKAEKVAHVDVPILQAQAGLSHALSKFLHRLREKLAGVARGHRKARKADAPSKSQLLKKMLPIDWSPLLFEIEPYMDEITIQGAVKALKGLGITNQEMISAVNEQASTWAKERAAELVGMKWVKGKLVENPNAEWAISDTTRDAIRDLVTNAFEERTSMADLADQIQESGDFSESRARMIARTEGARAQTQGNVEAWKGSGVVASLDWLLSEDHDDALNCDCPELAAGGPYPLDDLPDMPAHPNCSCVFVPNLTEE